MLVHLGPKTILAVDDLQWLDASSASALGFALRRAAVRLIASCRPGKRFPAGLEKALGHATTVELGPLSVAAIHELLQLRLGCSLPRPLLVRVHETTGGNPLYTLEVAREVLETGVAAGDPLFVRAQSVFCVGWARVLKRLQLTQGGQECLYGVGY